MHEKVIDVKILGDWVRVLTREPTGQYNLTTLVERAMGKIPATEFKARCLELMDRVAERREIFVITKRGREVAKLVPVERKPKESIFGCLRDKGSITGDIINPAIPFKAWESLKEWDELNADTPPRIGRRTVRKRRRSRR